MKTSCLFLGPLEISRIEQLPAAVYIAPLPEKPEGDLCVAQTDNQPFECTWHSIHQG